MAGVDWVPGISQGKAALQLLTGDVKGAKRTTENFCKECPGVSQVTSSVQLLSGNTRGAIETQKRCLNTVDNIANGIPVIGYPKSAIHHLVGDREGRDRALNAATRSTVAIGTAAATGGGAGAVIVGGMSYDIIRSATSNQTHGTVRSIENACENPSVGSIFDATYGIGQPAINPVVFRPCNQRGGTRVHPMYD